MSTPQFALVPSPLALCTPNVNDSLHGDLGRVLPLLTERADHHEHSKQMFAHLAAARRLEQVHIQGFRFNVKTLFLD